jgi:AAA family ATP:ADP antiporter
MNYFTKELSSLQKKKFLLLGLLMGAILAINHILWGIKNTLIVQTAGAEALSLLKLAGTVPCALFVTIAYTRLSNHYARKQLFYIILAPFFLFLLLFAFILYPNATIVHPSAEWIDGLCGLYPRWKTSLLLFGNWSFSLFYVVAEMWPSVALSLLFWQLANDTSSLQEARLFYPLFGFIGNIAVACCGVIIQFISLSGQYVETIQTLTIVVLCFGLCVFLLQHHIESSSTAQIAEEKPSLSFKESMLHLAKSKQLMLLACIVISFGVAQKIMENLWQDQLRLLQPTKAGYSAFLGQLSWISGLSTLILIAVGTFLLRRFGASFGPFYFFSLLLIMTTGLFFFFTITKSTPLITVWIGSMQDIINKVMKSCFCDPAKEMSYIPLDRELKVKGKAAVDVAADRFGKYGGAAIQQFLLITTLGSLVEIAPFLACISLFMIALWLYGVFRVERTVRNTTMVFT